MYSILAVVIIIIWVRYTYKYHFIIRHFRTNCAPFVFLFLKLGASKVQPRCAVETLAGMPGAKTCKISIV